MKFKSNMIGGKLILLRVVCLSSLCWLNGAGAIQDAQMAPPDVKLVDEFGVNIATGQVNTNQETVSIGGERGLSHSISMETNHFAQTGLYGYHDKYAGRARYTVIDSDNNTRYVYEIVGVMRVYGPPGSQDFWVIDANGQVDPYVSTRNKVHTFTYRAVGDTRHTLEVTDNKDYLIWTTPNGTESHYWRADGSTRHAGTSGSLRKIVYPNGFTLNIESLGGVTTNTGYQLKYDYLPPDVELRDKEKQCKQDLEVALASDDLQNPWANAGWAGRNPGRVIGVNNAVEYCPPDELHASENCDFDYDWPTARFEWPPGMPEALFLCEDDLSEFAVTGADGYTTKYYYKPYDLSLDGDTVPAGSHWKKGQKWSPRLAAIKSAKSNVKDRTYTYENDWGTGIGQMWLLTSEAGKVRKATGPRGERSGYSFFENFANAGQADYLNRGGLNSVETIADLPGKIRKAKFFKQGTFIFEDSYRNFVMAYSPETKSSARGPDLPGPQKMYYYDGRGNLKKVVMIDVFDVSKPATTIKAGYPDTCDNPKICNKPEWVKDAKGKQTDYTYHPESGQVATVTRPPDDNGVRPQRRYQYDQFYAYYKKDGNSVEKADSPIWLLAREEYCRTTAAVGDGCAGGPEDEVVTEYDYGPQDGSANNLHLRGVSVTALGEDGELQTRTTCYEYDIYGNRIGETAPKGVPVGGCP